MTLYDAYGRPVDTALLREEQAGPTLAGVRNIYSVAHPSFGLTPERLVAVLRDAEVGDPFLYLELAEEMEEKDLHYLSVLSTRKHTVCQLEMDILPPSDDPEDVRAADFARDVLFAGSLDLKAALFDVLDAIGKGFSASEIMWEVAGSQWLPHRLVWRDPRWFMFDWISGEQLLVRTLRGDGPQIDQQPGGYSHLAPELRQVGTGSRIGIQPATAPLYPFKFVVHITKAKAGLPIRGGIARIAGWAYLFKNYILKDWASFAETYGQPLRVGKYGPGATADDKAALLRAVVNIGTDAGAIIPDSMLIDFAESKSTAATADLYQRFCEYLDKQVSKGILGQTLTTEIGREGGSRAAAEVHDVVRQDIASDDALRLAATLNRDLVRPLIDLNLGPRRRYPRLTIGFPARDELQQFADALSPFIDRGLPVAQRTILERFGLGLPATGEPILHPVTKGRG